MRMFIQSVMAGLTLFAVNATAAEPLKLEQEADRINYSLGHQIGTDFKRQGVNLDSAAVSRGIEDALTGAAPLLDEGDMQQRLSTLKGQITDDMRSDQLERVKKRKADAERKRREGQAFLEENSNKPGVKTTASGLQYKVIREGSGDKPAAHDEVTIQYRGKKLSGQEFSNSYRKNKPKIIAVREMIPGIREAILLMQPGALWELYIPPNLSYGRRSPLAHQTVIVEIELLSINRKDSDTTDTGSETAESGDHPGGPE
ncbi:MAG: FKBP-type peptidyl-prolyl cis-trans isomerase N-terminal domain-containing protein [Gammaproteobacteria bacterium]|nr:FKBP-type peptidyl-prolyl cis-trans isomerase N-terminal domain-containing protein [Gammaproteobacteria bacterium]